MIYFSIYGYVFWMIDPDAAPQEIADASSEEELARRSMTARHQQAPRRVRTKRIRRHRSLSSSGAPRQSMPGRQG